MAILPTELLISNLAPRHLLNTRNAWRARQSALMLLLSGRRVKIDIECATTIARAGRRRRQLKPCYLLPWRGLLHRRYLLDGPYPNEIGKRPKRMRSISAMAMR